MKKSITKIALAVLLALGVTGTAVRAETGHWYATASGPTIYQTNWWYFSSTMNPPSRVPTTAVMNFTSWSVNFFGKENRVSTVALVNNQNDGFYLRTAFGSASGRSNVVKKWPAKQDLRFAFRVDARRAKLIQPSWPGGGHQLNINYEY